MIAFGEAKREENSEYFCRLTTQNHKEDIWIIPDCRRATDVQYFLKYFPDRVIGLRIQASDAVREKRGILLVVFSLMPSDFLGYEFTKGIDDAASECGLDQYSNWNFVVDNNNDQEALDQKLQEILSSVEKYL